jgi:HTH-type transcriptional regulator / antitoxin HigA
MSEDNLDDIDISALMRSSDDNVKQSLKVLFELKLAELNIKQTQALDAMQIESRALNALLTGGSSRVDLLSLLKLASFLDVSQTEAVNLYLNSLAVMNEEKINDLEKRKFILKNFNVTELKKEGIINSTADFDRIENDLVNIFNYNSIFDYRREVLNPAYSSSKLHSENQMCDYWIEYSRQIFRKIHNTCVYDRKALIEYFPTIRWHSMNVKQGIWEVIRGLYRIGITIIYLPKFKSLHIRGATFAVNKKPCIVLTDYRGFYPTLWFALLHELHHVLFEWDDILVNSHHISDKADLYTKTEIEDVADKFAKDYLFSDEKMKEILPHINNQIYIRQYAKQNHVHESIPYAFLAFEKNNWALAQKFMPDISECLDVVKDVSFKMAASEIAKFYTSNIYNKQ